MGLFNTNKRCALILLMVLLTFAFPASALASEEGTGDGSGGGSGVALTLVESTPKNGASDVATNVTITLLFNKNVVNLSVQETNRNAISLRDAGGDAVSIDILFPDDQVDREHRRDIYIDTMGNLKPGETYTLTISGSFMAKNGSNIDKAHTVKFTTKAEAVKKEESGAGVTGGPPAEEPDQTTIPAISSQPSSDKEPPLKEGMGEGSSDGGPSLQSETPSDKAAPDGQEAPWENPQQHDEHPEELNADESAPADAPNDNTSESEDPAFSANGAMALGLLALLLLAVLYFVKKRRVQR